MSGGECISHFRVNHRATINGCGLELGRARLVGDRVTKLDINEGAWSWFEEKDHEFLSEFRSVVTRLCKSVGHWSAMSISQDIESGVEVERL